MRCSVTVQASQSKAFEIFTAGFGSWWKRTGSGIGKSALQTAIIEPFAGGRWYEVGEDGVETNWGKVLAWEPDSRLLLAWQIGPDWQYHSDLVTEVEIIFKPDGPGTTRVELEHRHLDRMGHAAAGVRDRIGSPLGWPAKLAMFATVANEGA